MIVLGRELALRDFVEAGVIALLVWPSSVLGKTIPQSGLPWGMFWTNVVACLALIAWLDYGHAFVLYQVLVHRKEREDFGPLFRLPFLSRDNFFLRSFTLLFIPYVLTVYLFAIIYGLISLCSPASFRCWSVICPQPLTLLQSLYFSLTTASTVGYGDIAPNSPVAQIAAMAEILLSVFFAVFLFSIVGGALSEARNRQ